MRVVSLVPSATETLRAWGVDPVACTRFCEQPDLPHVGGTKDPDLAAIEALAPDLVVMDEEENRRPDHDQLVADGVAVHVLAIRDLADVDPAMDGLAEAVGARWVPLGPRDTRPVRRRVYVPIWRRPWMALGTPTYASSLLRSLGLANVAEGLGPYPALSPSEAADRRPDLVLAPDEPYPFGPRHEHELAVAAPVVPVDGRDLFWWGERTRGALVRLGQALDDR
jgi:ABC-type Fe3+-hydroxamate transport system substrate-binding protein